MAGRRKPPPSLDEDSYLEHDLDESLLNSPAKRLPLRNGPVHSRQTSTQQNNKPDDAAQDQHEAKLRQELVSVRKVNEAIEGVLASLEKAKSNMKNVNQTVNNASSLLNIWTRILSQTEHNQRLILDPEWQGASQDITDMEDEAQAKQQAVERKEVEEMERKAAATKKAEEDERRRAEAANTISTTTTKSRPGTRGRGVVGRGSSTGRVGYVGMGGSAGMGTGTTGGGRGTSSTSTRRTTSGLGRGTTSRTTRGRGS